MARFLGASLCLLASVRADQIWVHSANLSAAIDSVSGDILHVNSTTATGGISWDAIGLFSLGEKGSSPTVLNISVAPCDGGSVCITQWLSVVGQYSNASCCEEYVVSCEQQISPVSGDAGTPSSLAWSVRILSNAAQPWRTSLKTSFAIAATSEEPLYWVPRTGPECPSNACNSWRDALGMVNGSTVSPPIATKYGLGFYFEQDSAAREVSPVPAYVRADSGGDGLGLIAALDDAIFGLTTDADAGGANVTRWYNRLGGGVGVNVTYFLVPLSGADWRPLFAWGRAAFPRFFLAETLVAEGKHAAPAVAAAAAAAQPAPVPDVVATGLGLYTCAGAADWNVSEAVGLSGASINWDAHFWWPYIGLLLPPPAVDSWISNTGSGEQTACGAGFSHGDVVNRSRINASYTAAAAVGVRTLAYFNLVEFGEVWGVLVSPSGAAHLHVRVCTFPPRILIVAEPLLPAS